MALATPQLCTIQHFTHNHPLTKANLTCDFICNGCKTYGSDQTYRCKPCNYDLHEYCATCPLTLSTFTHPQHALNLIVAEPHSTRHLCDICKESIEGLFYRCNTCDFDVHPLCTQLPQHVPHVLHPAHHLEFRLGGDSPCMVCHGPCQSWRYRCELCKFDIHVECILATSPSDQTEAFATKSRVLMSPAGQPSPSQHGGYTGQQHYYNHHHPPQNYTYYNQHHHPQNYTYYNQHHPPQNYTYYNQHPPPQNYPYYNPPPQNYNNMNPGQVPDEGQIPGRRSKGRRIFTILSRLTIGVITNVAIGALTL